MSERYWALRGPEGGHLWYQTSSMTPRLFATEQEAAAFDQGKINKDKPFAVVRVRIEVEGESREGTPP